MSDAASAHRDASGYEHPGCIKSNPNWVDRVKSANRTCPGKPMTSVWDFKTEIAPFNKARARAYLKGLFSSRNLVPANDFNTPTFDDFIEPRDPPQIKGYSKHGEKRWRYQFPWQSAVQQNSAEKFSDDVAREWCNMTIVKEQRRLLEHIEKSNVAGGAALTLELDSAFRDGFDEYMRSRHAGWRCSWSGGGWNTCDKWDAAATLKNLYKKLDALTGDSTSELANFESWKALPTPSTTRALTNVSDYSFLHGDADDIDLCVSDPAAFNNAITKQVKAWYVGNQNTRLAQFLVNQNYTYITGVSVTTPTSDMTALNGHIQTQVETKWVSNADASFQAWLVSKGYSGFLTGALAISSVSQNIAALNDHVETQVEAKWVLDTDAALQAWLTSNGYTYVTNASITSVAQDVVALNINIKKQVMAAANNAGNNQLSLSGLKGSGESPTLSPEPESLNPKP